MVQKLVTMCDGDHGDHEVLAVRQVNWHSGLLDLCADCADKFDPLLKQLTFWQERSRDKGDNPPAPRKRVQRPNTRNRARKATDDNAELRAWAIGQGYEVAKRGRIRDEVREAFRAARVVGNPPEPEEAPDPAGPVIDEPVMDEYPLRERNVETGMAVYSS